jgi:hypothetical protein
VRERAGSLFGAQGKFMVRERLGHLAWRVYLFIYVFNLIKVQIPNLMPYSDPAATDVPIRLIG